MNFKALLAIILITLTTSVNLRRHKAEADVNYYINLDAENWIYGSNKDAYDKSRFVSIIKHSVSTECPKIRPYTVDGVECFQCPTAYPVFNLSTLKCERCPKENSLKDHACV